MTRGAVSAAGRAEYLRMIPQGRYGEADEVGSAIAFLLATRGLAMSRAILSSLTPAFAVPGFKDGSEYAASSGQETEN
jgi:NAD(P)-dependent dehydrogenase (short-subunit alcohol dehydrogenase family)